MVDLVLTEADAGRTVEVAPGKAVQLRLPENPTTGYRWVMTMTPASCLEIGSNGFDRDPKAPPGAGGVRVVAIASVTAPACELALAYRRPWETDAPAASELLYRFVTP
jgi:inhibitor of cysteine peptidase